MLLSSLCIELFLTVMVSHNSITLVHQKKIWSIPHFGRRTYLTTRVDNQANFFKVLGANDFFCDT